MIDIGILADQAEEDGEQAGAFDESADDDGGQAVVVGLLRLAGAGLEGGLTDVADTESGGDGGDGGADGGAGLSEACSGSGLENHGRE